MGKKSFAGILIGVALLAAVINGQGPLEIRAAQPRTAKVRVAQ